MVEHAVKIQIISIVSNVRVQLDIQAKFVKYPLLSYVCNSCSSSHHRVSFLFSASISATGCTPGCQNGGLCNGNICVCLTGYTGTFCEIRSNYLWSTLFDYVNTINEYFNILFSDYCLPSNPCQNGGQCTSTGISYVCDCTGTGYDGATCTNLISTSKDFHFSEKRIVYSLMCATII